MLDDLKEAFLAYILRTKVVGQSSPISNPNQLQGLMLGWMRRIHLVLHFSASHARVDASHPPRPPLLSFAQVRMLRRMLWADFTAKSVRNLIFF